MQLSIVSWNGSTDINNGTEFSAWYETGQTFVQRQPTYIERTNRWQKLAGADLTDASFTFKILCLGTIHSQRETIKSRFSLENYSIGTLIVQDTADSNRQWYIKGMPIKVFEEETGVMVITLAIDEPAWRTVVSSTDQLTITASGDSTDFAVSYGNLNARPIFTITPVTPKTGDYAYQRWIMARNPTNKAMVYYPLDIANGLDTAAIIAAGKIKSSSDGADVRVFIDGAEADRWLSATTDNRGLGTTDCAIWSVMDFPTTLELTLSAAMTSDSTSAIIVDDTPINVFNMIELSKRPNKVIYIDSEAIMFTDAIGRGISGTTRGAKGTTPAAHAAGATIYHVPHDIWLLYGSSDATAPVTDDTRKPLQEIRSTNTSWIYASFYDATSPRPAAWTPQTVNAGIGRLCTYYTSSDVSDTNPAVEMGGKISAYKQLIWKPDSGEIVWSISVPAGVSTVSASGYKYRASSTYPIVAALQYRTLAGTWISADNQATPASAATWTAFTIASTDTGALGAGYENIRFRFAGYVNAADSNYAAYTITDATLGLESTGIPVVVVGAEQSTYRLQCTIENTTTGESMSLDANIGINRTITIDCDAKTVTLDDGTNLIAALSLSTIRDDWLNLQPGSNTITYTETGAVGLTLGAAWEGRETM